MSDHIKSAMNLLRIVRQTTDAIGVAVSFGKDSLATLDLCCRMFLRVEGYYLFRVRGMAIVDEWATTCCHVSVFECECILILTLFAAIAMPSCSHTGTDWTRPRRSR